MILHIHSRPRVVEGQEHRRKRNHECLLFYSRPCKHLQVPFHSPFNSIVNKGVRVYAGFKLQCLSTNLHLKNGINRKRKGDKGVSLQPILRSLATESDLEETLDQLCGELSARDLTVILKEQGSWEKVVRVFEWMKSQEDYIPNEIHYNVVLRALGRAEKWDELRLCWSEMAKDGVSPSNTTYAILVDVYGKAGLGKEALLWIKHMMLRGIFPDEVTMNTVVKVLKDSREYDWADRFYKDWCVGKIKLDDLDFDSIHESGTSSSSEPFSMKQFLLTELFRTGVRNPYRAMELSKAESSLRKPQLTTTYNTLIDLYAKAGRIEDAANVFADMLNSGVELDTFTFNTMIFICGNLGNFSEAQTLLHKMEERGIFADTKTYNIFLSLHANAGNIDIALQYYRKIRENGLFPDDVTCKAIIHILCKKKMVHEVEAVLKEMESLGKRIDVRSLPNLMELYISEGLTERANALLEKFQLIGGIPSKTYAAIMDGYANHGLWAEAEDVFFSKRDMFRKKKTVLEYNVMFKAYGKAKMYDKAFSLFKGMKSQGTWPDECTYNSLIQMFSGGDLVDQAIKLLIEMRDVGFRPSCKTFSAIIASYVRRSRLCDAVDMFQEMLKAGVKPNEVVFGSLIDGFAEVGNLEEAINYFHEMEECGLSPNRIILTSMIKAYSTLGSVEGAKHIYEKMKHLDTGPDTVASASMLNMYATLGMISDAKLIFRDLCQSGKANSFIFATMIYAYKNIGMLGEATEIAEEMIQSGFLRDCNTFNQVMSGYCANGQLVECGKLLHEMVYQKILPDQSTFKILFSILQKGRFPVEAVKQLESSYQERKDYVSEAVITSVFSVVGLHAFALESCENILKAAVRLDSFAYNVAIYAYGASGKIGEALNIFMRMQGVGLKPDIVTYVNLVICYGKAGLVNGIQRIYEQLESGAIEKSASLYIAVIDAYKDAGSDDLAYLVSQEMRFAFSEEQYPNDETEGYIDETVPGKY